VISTGTACSSSRDRLDETKLVLSRSGSELRVEAVMPENEMFGSSKLDFDVVVPDTIRQRQDHGRLRRHRSSWCRQRGKSPTTAAARSTSAT
jgi:hypothetical protein